MYYPAFHILGIEIPTWFIFGWLNILLGKSLLLYLGYRRGWPFSSWLLIVLFSTVGGGLGAIFSSSIMGVVLGAVGFMFFGKWALGFRHQIGDIIAIYLAVLIGIGRFGCLLNGCCFGSPTDLPWGITYSVGTPAHWLHLFSGQIDTSTLTSLAIHPIQFYESIFLFLAALVVMMLSRKIRNKNVILLGFLSSYFLFRFTIEFIRDMTNVWWSLKIWGPLSYFQWFLTGVAVGCLIIAFWTSRSTTASLTRYAPKLNQEGSLLFIAFLLTLVFHNRFQPIHLFQLLILFPFSLTIWVVQVRSRFSLKLLPAGGGLVAALLIIIIPLSTALRGQLEKNHSLTGRGNNRTWLYVLDEQNLKLVRLGDEKLTFSEFARIRNSLNLYQKSTLSDSSMYNQISESLPNSKIYYYGALGYGNYSYDVESCGGRVTTYHHNEVNVAGGIEKRIINNNHTSYLGIRGALFTDRMKVVKKEDSFMEEHSYLNSVIIVNPYGSYEFRWFGLGLGIFGGYIWYEGKEKTVLHPGLYARLGPPVFNIEMGLLDQYAISINPYSTHFNVSLSHPNGVIRIGALLRGTNRPLGLHPFAQVSFELQNGIILEPALIVDKQPSAGLKVSFPVDNPDN